eukprot:TRINITY_DN26509_c0_g1_i1.p1 TRINITY_DN26509_c0_g1~~TRINITY_DN26509_c0_g1_i1.p1  ORF type:complete len:675 (-),score=170.71 TRINITY_DN26509_c0_g1_i1:104-2128(-)
MLVNGAASPLQAASDTIAMDLDAEDDVVEAAANQPKKRRRDGGAIDVDAEQGGCEDSPEGNAARLKCVQKQLRKLREQMASLRAQEALLVAEESQLSESLALEESERTRAVAAGQDWTAGFDWDAPLMQCLRKTFGHKGFRPLQLEAINAVLSGKDAFAIMPTGSGKSLCYQLPAQLWSAGTASIKQRGTTLIISPLLALMHDQIRSLRSFGIEAKMLNSDCDKDEKKTTLAALGAGTLPLCYVTPEFLAKSKVLLSKLQLAWKAGRFRLIAVDEAHCCSQWGHEFRPDYLKLKILRENFPDVPILALTATATTNVQRDVESQLGIRGCLLLRGRYNRPNLFYSVALKPEKKDDEISWLAKFILSRHAGKCGLIYCLSCKDTEQVAAGLCQKGVLAEAYHAQRQPYERQAAYNKWRNCQVQVIVATIAFGMGIDKPDVRFVIHHTLPKSVENYYQESGRAGRDGQPADCVLLFRPADVQRLTSMAAENTNRERNVKLVYEMLAAVDSDKGFLCRRKALATYFGDKWQPGDCAARCDFCSGGLGATAQQDVSQLATQLLRLIATALENEAAGGHRLTLLKAIDLARSDAAPMRALRKGAASDKALRAAAPRDLERILARLLAQDYLSEEFVYTAYSANGYLRLTAKGRDALRATQGLQMSLLRLPTAEELKLPSM